jgi:excisionase family DNA binding protein
LSVGSEKGLHRRVGLAGGDAEEESHRSGQNGLQTRTNAARRRTPRLALTRAEAAASLGMSVDSFERYVQSEIRLVRRGSLRLVPLAELEAWLLKNAEQPLPDPR